MAALRWDPQPHARPCLAFRVQHHPSSLRELINSMHRPGTADQHTRPLAAALTHGVAMNQYGARVRQGRAFFSPLRKTDARNNFGDVFEYAF